MTIGLAVLLLLAAVLVNGKFYRSNFTECKCVCFFVFLGGRRAQCRLRDTCRIPEESRVPSAYIFSNLIYYNTPNVMEKDRQEWIGGKVVFFVLFPPDRVDNFPSAEPR